MRFRVFFVSFLTVFVRSCISQVKIVRGREGEGELHEFNRPSGLCCDDSGRVVVADSKNQRVLVYNTNIELQWVVSDQFVQLISTFSIHFDLFTKKRSLYRFSWTSAVLYRH